MAGMTYQTRLRLVAVVVMAGVLGTGCATGAAPSTRTATPSATAAAATALTAADLNGTYRWEITHDEAEAAGMVDPEDTYPQVSTVTLNNGELEGGCFGAAGGTYKVAGNRITFHSNEYEYGSTVTFTSDEDGSLHLTPVPPMDAGDAFQCFSKPWTKIE